MNVEGLAGGWMMRDSLGDLDHSARFSKIECAWSEEEKFFGVMLL